MEAVKRLLIALQLFAMVVGGALPALGEDKPVCVGSEVADGSEFGIGTVSAPSVDSVSSGSGQEPQLKALEPKFDNRINLSVTLPNRLYPLVPNLLVSNSDRQLPHDFDNFAVLRGFSKIAQVKLITPFDSKAAVAGQPVQAVLLEDFRLGEIKIASAGSLLNGQITSAVAGRTLASSAHDASRRFKSRGCVELRFDELVDRSGKHIPVTGTLVKQMDVMPGEKRWEVRVDKRGRIIKSERSLTPEQQRAYNIVRAATMVPVPLPGNFILVNCVGVPLALGVGGAADPSFAYNKPIDDDVSNRRLKGFTYAFVSNLPGAFAVQAFTEKGTEVVVKSGLELSVNLIVGSDKQPPFTPPKTAVQENLASAAPPPVTGSGGTRLLPAYGSLNGSLLPGESKPMLDPAVHKNVRAMVLTESPTPGN